MKKWISITALLAIFLIGFIIMKGNSATSAADESDLLKGMEDAILLYVGNSNAYVRRQKRNIDENLLVVPTVVEGSTLVPVRFIAESLGGIVGWDEQTKKVTITLGKKTIGLMIDSDKLVIDGKTQTMPIKAIGLNNRTLVPLRAVSEAFGKEVFYDKGLIIISNQKDIVDAAKDKARIDGIIRMVNVLPKVESKEELKKLLEGFVRETGYFNEAITMDLVAPSIEKSASGSTAQDTNAKPEDYSKTNVQVEGVDEGDVVKTDGKYIYQLNGNKVLIIDASTPNNMKLVKELSYGSEFRPIEMFVDEKNLVVLGNVYESKVYATNLVENVRSFIGKPYYTSTSYTRVYIYNIENKNDIVLKREAQIEGDYVSARKIDQYLYFVSNKYIRSMDEILPLYKDTNMTKEEEVSIQKINCILPITTASYMTIGSLDLNANAKMNVESYLGAGDNIYASLENIYVSVQNYEKNATDVYKFSMEQGRTTYLNKGEVEGYLINQYSMDEQGAYFRIATTTNRWDEKTRQSIQCSNLFVLNDSMYKVGEITQIAPGERIYSTRFMGDRAYMVTFKNVDPLFVIDLKEPKAPKILGALKIPGFSNYLHPYDENHIIGFGKDTIETKTGALTQGMKIALFDVTDVENPIQQFVEVIGARGTESIVLQNPRALLFSKQKNLFALPITVYQQVSDNNTVFEFEGAYVYSLDLEKGFNLKYKLTHVSEEEYKKAGNYYYNYNKRIQRLVYIKDAIYSLSNAMIQSSDFETGKTVGSLSFKMDTDGKYDIIYE